MAEIFLSETNYEAMFDKTIDANSYPTTTNFLSVENYFANLLLGKLTISTAPTSDPMLSMCKLWTGLMIREFGVYNEVGEKYATPEKFVASPHFLTKLEALDPIVETIRDNFTTEDEPAYTRRMGLGYYGGGAELD